MRVNEVKIIKLRKPGIVSREGARFICWKNTDNRQIVGPIDPLRNGG